MIEKIKWCGAASIGNYRTISFKCECDSCDLYEYDMCANRESTMTERMKNIINEQIDAGAVEGCVHIDTEPKTYWKAKLPLPPKTSDPDELWEFEKRELMKILGIPLE